MSLSSLAGGGPLCGRNKIPNQIDLLSLKEKTPSSYSARGPSHRAACHPKGHHFMAKALKKTLFQTPHFLQWFYNIFPKHPLSIVTWTPTKPPVFNDFHICPLTGTYFVPKITVSTILLAPLFRNLQFLQSQTHLSQPRNSSFQTPQFLH